MNLDWYLYEQTEENMVEVQNTSGLSWIEARFNICLLIPSLFRQCCQIDPSTSLTYFFSQVHEGCS